MIRNAGIEPHVLEVAAVAGHADLCSGLIDPEEDDGGEADGGHEGVRAAVITHGDVGPVLQPAEHVLDAVPLVIELSVMRDALPATPI